MVKCKFSDVSERDMDLLFLEEFVASTDFLDIFLSKINLIGATVCEIEHSKVDVEFGESDMTLIVEYHNKKYGLLIEDKIDATAMPEQSSRYDKRGQKGVDRGDYDYFFVFIVAPSKYLESNEEAKKYKHQVTYEECLDYFRSRLDSRSQFKVQQIEQAIHKQKHGYQVIENTKITAFWDKYISYQEENYPDLWLMSKRGPKGAHALWPEFATVIDKVTIYHKSEVGYIDLTIPGAAQRIVAIENALKQVFGDLISLGITPVKTGKSAALRIKVSPVDFRQDFEMFYEEIECCFKKIRVLSEFAKEISMHESITTLL